MKKLLLIPIIVLLFAVKLWAIGPATLMMFSGGGFCNSSTADCCEDFDAADTGDVDANTNFDAETDTASKIDISVNRMRFYASVSEENGQVEETTCFSSNTEITVKFVIRFEDIVDIDGDTNDHLWVAQIKDSDSTIAVMRISTDANGDLLYYRAFLGQGAVGGNEVTMTGVAADTDYTVYFYYKEDATVGEAACKIGAWAESTTDGDDDNSADDGVARADLGGIYNEFGDGGVDTYIIFDNFEVFFGDEMP